MLYSPAHGDVAQLGEHRLCKPRVEGSSPFVSTKNTAGQKLIGLLACLFLGAAASLLSLGGALGTRSWPAQGACESLAS